MNMGFHSGKSGVIGSRLRTAGVIMVTAGLMFPVLGAQKPPREPRPRPRLPIVIPSVPTTPFVLNHKPKIDIRNKVALPDLEIMRGVRTVINPRLAAICRAGNSGRSNVGIPVLNFTIKVQNVGRGTAFMNRYGVILSAQTMDFRERVFDTNKRYQGGTGGPGSFQGPRGRQAWKLVRMAPLAPRRIFVGHTGLGIGWNNTRFTVSRLHELAGQTHRFLIQLKSYGNPGLRETNIRNNKMIVSYTFPKNFCTTGARGVSTPVGPSQILKPVITGFSFPGGKQCLHPGAIFAVKGAGFGRSRQGRVIEVGGNGYGIDLRIKSWSARKIVVKLPTNARLQYHKTYWVAINRPHNKGHLSNLKRGVKICPVTVRVGGSARPNSGTASPGSQNNGNGIIAGLPDLTISRLTFGRPKPFCFQFNDSASKKKNYFLGPFTATLTLKNTGPVAYSTRDPKRNRQLPIGIMGDRLVIPRDRHGYSLCAGPTAQGAFSNLNIPAGASKTIRTKLTLFYCKPPRKGVVKKLTVWMPGSLVNQLMGRRKSIKIGIGKAAFIRKNIPVERSYTNNFARSSFTFPNRKCSTR